MATRSIKMFGNHKMHDTVDEFSSGGILGVNNVIKAFFMPDSLLHFFPDMKETHELGSQNCHWEGKGAYTSQASVSMLKRAGCKYVLVGHWEVRKYLGDTDEIVAKKAAAAIAGGLHPVICISNAVNNNTAGQFVLNSLKGSVHSTATNSNSTIAWEPAYAIEGTKPATISDIVYMHGIINTWGRSGHYGLVQALYGGSLKPENAKEILATPDVGGGLIGGASMTKKSFNRLMVIAGNEIEKRLTA